MTTNIDKEIETTRKKLEELEIPVKSHMSVVDDETVEEIKARLRGIKQEPMEEIIQGFIEDDLAATKAERGL
jgi:hypothetical protein